MTDSLEKTNDVCKNCGKKLQGGEVYCANCGTKIAQDETKNSVKKNKKKRIIICSVFAALVILMFPAVVFFLFQAAPLQGYYKNISGDPEETYEFEDNYYEQYRSGEWDAIGEFSKKGNTIKLVGGGHNQYIDYTMLQYGDYLCANVSKYEGTFSRNSKSAQNFYKKDDDLFGAITLLPDGTYTEFWEYIGSSIPHTTQGTYSIQGDKLLMQPYGEVEKTYIIIDNKAIYTLVYEKVH